MKEKHYFMIMIDYELGNELGNLEVLGFGFF